MKRFLLTICIAITCLNLLYSQGFNFSTSVRNSSGEMITNTDIKLQITILENASNGNIKYIEQHQATTNAYGIANIKVGNGNVISGNFSNIDWSSKLFLKAEIAQNGSNTYTHINTSEIGAVPYTMHSNTASELSLTSPNGNKWNISVDNEGNITAQPQSGTISNIEYGTVDYIFDDTALPTITLEISTDEWNTLLSNFDINPNNEDCVHADFYFEKNGTIHKVEDIGLRLRGNTSRRRPEGNTGEMHNADNPDWHHCHFAFRFAKFVDDQLFSGTDRFSLRFAKDDPTYVHEIYSYDLLRRFGVWTTPKSSYCRLKIKIKEDNATVYWGVYEMFEGIDDQFLDDRTTSGNLKAASGYLWKMSWGSGIGAYLTADHANANLMGISDNPTIGESANFTYDYKSKKKKFEAAKAQFIQFITDLNSKTGTDFESWAEQNINIDLLLKAYAVTVAVGQWDDYWGNGNNYYLYFDTDGRCHYIPYDFDNALGTSSDGIMYDPGTGDPLKWGNDNRPLITKVLAVDRWMAQYKEYLAQLINPDNDYLDADKSIARIEGWYKQIKSHVNNDTGEDCEILDQTASWSSGIKNYRILTGDDQGGSSTEDPNFFKTRIRAIKSALK